jgi:hypothetical protein
MYCCHRAYGLLVCLAPVVAFAHHGTRFLLAVEFDMVRQPFLFVNGAYSEFRHQDNDLLMEPALLLPVGKNGMSEFEIHGHFEQPGSEPLRHEATGFELRHRFTRQPRWNFAAGLEYETTVPNTEEPNNWTATLVAGKEDAKGLMLFNLVDQIDAAPGTKSAWGYRAAYSPTPKGLVNYSLEFQGDFKSHGSHEVALGFMEHLDMNTMLKLGIGTGLTSESPRMTFRIGLVRALGGIE